jgi:hypothetical protein
MSGSEVYENKKKINLREVVLGQLIIKTHDQIQRQHQTVHSLSKLFKFPVISFSRLWLYVCMECNNEELHNLYSSPSTIIIIKSRRMRWAWHVA